MKNEVELITPARLNLKLLAGNRFKIDNGESLVIVRRNYAEEETIEE